MKTESDQVIQDIDDIKQNILTYIQELYKKKYVGELIVKTIQPYGYQVTFGLNVTEKPLVVAAQLNKCSFLKFIKQDIRDRSMDFVKYFKGIQMYPEYCQIDSSCSCQKTN